MTKKKLWDKGFDIDKKVEEFTVGQDRELDLYLAEYDVLGSIAQAKMLNKVRLLNKEELIAIHKGLLAILKQIQSGQFSIQPGTEDIHSQIEQDLYSSIGPIAGKLHTARSRNDQVLLDLKLLYRKEISILSQMMLKLSSSLIQKASKHKDSLMPGYTHTQLAMKSSFGMWFMAGAESLFDDACFGYAIFPLINKNPLGSAAGYGSSFPIDRKFTSTLLGFESLHINPINAQNKRGKTELILAQWFAQIGLSLNKICSDLILYSNENHKFFNLPKTFTTGSSIMPHKKNPDVYEIMRAHTNEIMALPNQITMNINNLTTGYHRDLQLLKAVIFPAIEKIKELLTMLDYTIEEIEVNEALLQDEKYEFIDSVDAVNELVMTGIPFREAYKIVGEKIEKGEYSKSKILNYTHLGSIGNLGILELKLEIEKKKGDNPYHKIDRILSKLLEL